MTAAVEARPAPRTIAAGPLRRLVVPVVTLTGFAAVLALVWGNPIATWWNFHIATRIDSLQEWLILNRDSNWLFTWFFDPISRALNDLVQWNLNALNFLTWIGVKKVKQVGPPERAIEQGREIPKALKGKG